MTKPLDLNSLYLTYPTTRRFIREADLECPDSRYAYVTTQQALYIEKLKATLSAIVDQDPQMVFGCNCTPTTKCVACRLREIKE